MGYTDIFTKSKEKQEVRAFEKKLDDILKAEGETINMIHGDNLTSAKLKMISSKISVLLNRSNGAEQDLLKTTMQVDVKKIYLVRITELKTRLLSLKSTVDKAISDHRLSGALDIGIKKQEISKKFKGGNTL